MVYGRYNYSFHGDYNGYNWGAPSCSSWCVFGEPKFGQAPSTEASINPYDGLVSCHLGMLGIENSCTRTWPFFPGWLWHVPLQTCELEKKCEAIEAPHSYQWIGLRENSNRKAPYLMGKSMVSCKISLKPIQSFIAVPRDPNFPPAIFRRCPTKIPSSSGRKRGFPRVSFVPNWGMFLRNNGFFQGNIIGIHRGFL